MQQIEDGLYCFLIPPNYDGTLLMKEMWTRAVLPETVARSVTRWCVLPRRLLTLVCVMALLPVVVTAAISRTVLLYGTTSLSVRGGLPIPIGSACPPTALAASRHLVHPCDRGL